MKRSFSRLIEVVGFAAGAWDAIEWILLGLALFAIVGFVLFEILVKFLVR
jgi:hypothetical protein